MNDTALIAHWSEIYARPVSGWDFSELEGVAQDDAPWNYEELVRGVLKGASSALDIGTGGGEFLSQISDAVPPDTVATEGWEPNVPTASAALGELGIPVVSYRAGRDACMPFEGNRFDAVMARHEAYDAAEVFRVLRPGGVFVTQQVEAENLRQLRVLLGFATPYPQQTLEAHVDSASAVGLAVEVSELWEGQTTFPHVASLVRYLAMVPWEAPGDFSPERYADTLLGLETDGAPITFAVRRFLLMVRRPALGA